MRQAAGLIAASLLLAGCTTSVLESRRETPAGRPWGRRTLVVARVAEPYRAATEDAIARQLPGAVAAHDLSANSEVSAVWSPLFADVEEAFLRDTLVLVSVKSTATSEFSPGGGNDPSVFSDLFVRIDLDVSVLRTADRKEIYGTTIRRNAVGPGVEKAEELAPSAAARAGRELAASGLFH